MEAPDKIFCWRGVLDTLFCSLKKGTNTDCTEYIRKDLLLEWAKEMEKRAEYKFDDDNGDMCWGYEIAIGEVIEKLESL